MKETKTHARCEQCNESISLAEWNEDEVADFHAEHEECEQLHKYEAQLERVKNIRKEGPNS